jgi:hypothetical protein
MVSCLSRMDIQGLPTEGERNQNQLHRLGRQIFSFRALLAVVLVAKVYWTCREQIADPDIWWHLRNAQYFAANLRFPNIDTYSFTAAGSPWVNHEWLSELFYYAAFRTFGLQGIFVVFASALAVLVVAVFSLCLKQTDDPLAAAIATIFGGLLAMVGFTPRTQHFGWLCFVAIYAILLGFRSKRRGPLWLIPVLFCVWVNCHGSWLIGLFIYVMFVGAGLIRRDIGRLVAAPWSNSELKKLILTGLASVAALAVNPFGYRLLMYPFDTAFRQNLGVGTVQEWASVDFNDPRGKLVGIVLGAIFAMALIAQRRWRIDDALLTAFVLYCGLTHVRFLLLAGIVLPPILAPHFGRISSYSPEREHRLLNAALLAIAVGVFVIGFPSARMLDAEVSGFFPFRAVEFLRAHPQQGHIFNLFQWGGYLEWNLPQAPTFIDSRSDIFEHKGVLKDYWGIAGLSDSQEILDRYQVSYLLYPPDTALSYFLSKSPQWERIYGDEQALIYRRVGR